MKSCTKCKMAYSFDFFYKSSNFKDGLHPHCKDCKKKSDKERYERKKELICKQTRERYKLNQDRERAAAKIRYEKSIATDDGRRHVLDRKNAWAKQKAITDPSYRVNRSVSREISRQINKKGKSYLKYVNYSIPELMLHLERQFDKNMSWDNYGSYWHIDHIVPKSSFKIKEIGDEDFLACWALANLRPLEAIKNISKGSKIESLI